MPMSCTRFCVKLTVTGAATFVAPFIHMDAVTRTTLIETVARELDLVLRPYIQREQLVFSNAHPYIAHCISLAARC
jgi:hypothetical protein